MSALRLNLPYVFRYDGSFEGFLCCVFASFSAHGRPAAIVPEGEEEQLFLLPVREIETEREKALRVYRSIVPKISARALHLVERAFRSCLPGKELLLLDFLDQGYESGDRVLRRLTDDTVHALLAAVRAYNNEAERFRQFLRFADYDGILAGEIEPQNDLLVDLAPHFTARYPNEHFLIYDAVRKKALLYRPREWTILPLEEFSLGPVTREEARYEALWKLFYDTVAIEERKNERCRLNHLPKRYWKHMTEFRTEASVRGIRVEDARSLE